MKPYITKFAQTQADPSGFLADYKAYQKQLNQEKEENMLPTKTQADVMRAYRK